MNEAQNSYCQSCRKRIANYVTCPWCKELNDAGDSFCCFCGKMMIFTPFPYSDKANTPADKLREVLATSGADKRVAKRLVPNMRLEGGHQCPNCGGTDGVLGASREDIASPVKSVGLRAVVAGIQELIRQIGEPDEDLNEYVSERLQDTALWICLACGEIWVAISEGKHKSVWSANADAPQ